MIPPFVPPPGPFLGLEHSVAFLYHRAGALSPDTWIDLKGHIFCGSAQPQQSSGNIMLSWSISLLNPTNL